VTWYRKEQPTPFDTTPIDGLFFLDSDALSKLQAGFHLEGHKRPAIFFPSGLIIAIWEANDPTQLAIISLFDEMELPYKQSRNEAYLKVKDTADELGYIVEKVGEEKLEVHGYGEEEHFLVSYDAALEYITDVLRLPPSERKQAKHPAHVLMNDEIRQSLPPLYSNEEKGLEAIAPVKYFHKLSGWRWYASEYDPEQGLFFGLVDGYETELGYFSLDELEEIGKDKRTIPIERDLYYKPQTLQELIDYHRKLRNE
jgi:hypothetical protein